MLACYCIILLVKDAVTLLCMLPLNSKGYDNNVSFMILRNFWFDMQRNRSTVGCSRFCMQSCARNIS